MGIQDLQTFLESSQVEGSCVGVDLVRIARTQAQKWVKQVHKKPPNGNGKFHLVVDAECCLDRLYGGYFSDWVCGGQWNRVTAFLGQFVNSLHVSNIELTVFFNGCPQGQRSREWVEDQLKARNRISMVLRHLANKGTPPPKVWWTPPSCLRPTLRMVLRNLNVSVIVTMDDHKQEVIAFCRENQCHGIVADDAEYIAFDPPRYFSARHLKLTYKGTLESKEYIVSELIKGLSITGDELCVVAALLGNFLLPETELSDLHRKLIAGKAVKAEDMCGELVRSLAKFVKTLDTSDLDKAGLEIFGAVGGDRAAKFRRAVQYYLDGTKGGFLKYRASGADLKKAKNKSLLKNESDKTESFESSGLDTSRLASEAGGNELAGLMSVSEAVACLSVGPEINVEETKEGTSIVNAQVNGGTNHALLTSSNSSSSSGATSPARIDSLMGGTNNQPKDEKELPPVAAEILRTVCERHSKGLMSPFIYRLLTTGEVRLPVVMEDESHKEIPSIQLFYRPLRRMVYAILFNLHHLTYLARQAAPKGGEIKIPEIKIKEWVWSKPNPYQRPEVIRAEPLGWGVPTIQRLWFGTTVDDKRRRLRAYLTCMRSDTQLMLNPSYVPQHLLVLATVLRYIMSFPDKGVLRKHELDAIIATAMDPQLSNSEYNQELSVECVSPRGVQLGCLVMTGVEYALIVNEACGAPIPWLMSPPWLYFDGKLLHAQLARAATVKNLLELCGHRIPQVMKVERMREAILDGLYVQWARPPLLSPLSISEASRVHAVMPAGMATAPPGRQANPVTRGALQPSIRGRGMTTGGRLEIAGVVVGHWGPNCRLMAPPPQNTGRRKALQAGNAKKEVRKTGKGRGMTIVNPYTGEVVNAAQLLSQDDKKRILTNSENNKTQKNAAVVENGESKSVPLSDASVAPELKVGEASNLIQQGMNCQVNGETNNSFEGRTSEI